MSFFRSIASWRQTKTTVDGEDSEGRGTTKPYLVRTLGRIVERARNEDVVRKDDLGFGDQVIVTTRNSVYSLWTLGDGTFAVSGGWFDQREISPTTVAVNGCTYGGSAIRQDIVAGRGLFLEFGNNVSTTRIEDIRVLRSPMPTDFGPLALPC